VSAHSGQAGLAAKYDRIAEKYAAAFFDELDKKPFDRALLDRFAAAVAGRGRVCDVGCGPGHVGRYLAARGVDVFGLDLSPRMVELARRLNPGLGFEQGDVLALALSDASLAGIAAFYSLIHLARDTVARALGELTRVLAPGGRLLIAFHGGSGEVHAEEWFGEKISMRATLFEPDEMRGAMEAAGLVVDAVTARDPYDFEYPTRRVYAVAMKRG
jgi:SAM-dependent methyltransferase